MKIETMWCVRDPGHHSKLADICYQAQPKDLVAVIGGLYSAGLIDRIRQMESLELYTDETEARADAEQRLAARDARLAASTSTGACRVWELFDGNVRLFENGDAKHWDDNKGRWSPGWGSWGTSPIVRIDEVRYEEWQTAIEEYRSAAPHSKSTGP